jgi:hypothetical protein
MWSRIIKFAIHKMQEFIDDRFMLLTRMSVLGVGIVCMLLPEDFLPTAANKGEFLPLGSPLPSHIKQTK